MTSKIFFVTGELSGDKVAAIYLQNLKKENPNIAVQAIGGDALASSGAPIYKRFEELNVTGITEIIKHIPRLLSLMSKLAKHIISNQFDEIVLVDFPGFNMRLGKILKKKNPNLKITYLCPPQMWCWGAWRIKKLKQIADKVVVIYPFEVEWYKNKGLETEWLGNPVFMRLKPYINDAQPNLNMMAIIPGSRKSEIIALLPQFAEAAYELSKLYPNLKFVIPIAESLPFDFLQNQISKSALGAIADKVEFARGEEAKIMALQTCCLALSKPGTITLELALLGIPTAVAYKTSWLSYLIARLLVKVKYMSLPNLLLGQEIFPEIIQQKFTSSNIVAKLKSMYEGITTKSQDLDELKNKLRLLKKSLDNTY